ncbi:MAG: DNA-cytosine methyltransferase [Herbinix sp.]|jgi:DNA (cytosine-5)-methyltransferase 1|nr:DNA-cytosine methyltransferase [Herbinix sp.]
MFDYECSGNMTIFDMLYPTFEINNPIRLIELFGGVGSQAMALRNIGADFEHYKLVEYDKYPVASYNAIHGTDFKPTDIREVHGNDLGIVDTDKYTYILTYSFPCQDLSVAGKMKGMSKGSGTRSGLLWEVERLLTEMDNLPQVLLMENVPQVISDANIADFRLWQDFLESKGYTNYVEVLNAKDYGVAQNRERCFMVSLLGQWNYKFPQQIPLTKTMAEYLEDEVDEKYYINTDKAQKLIDELITSGKISQTDRQTDRQAEPVLMEQLITLDQEKLQTVSKQDMMPEFQTCVQRETWLLSVNELGFIEKGTGKHQSNTVYSTDGISPCLNAVNYKESIKVVCNENSM